MKTFENYIMEIPLAEIIIDGESKGLHNELTVRNLAIAYKRKLFVCDSIVVKFDNKNENTPTIIATMNSEGKFSPPLKGFMDVSYNLAFELID